MNNGIEDRHTGKQPKSVENKGWFPYGCYDLCDRWKKTLSNRCNHIETTLQRSLWNDVSATIAEVWYSYDHNDCWTFFPAIAAIIGMIWKPALMVLMMSETFLLWFIKSWAVLLSRWSRRGWGICLLFWSYPGAFDGLICPHPREFAISKKNANARGWPGGGWALMELTDA